MREATRAVELFSLVLGDVAESLQDVLGRAVQWVAQALVPLTDRELPRRFTELAVKKMALEAQLGLQSGQVEKAREHFRTKEERMQGLERELVAVTEQVEEVRDQLVGPRATEVVEDMDEDLGERRMGEEREKGRRSFGRVARVDVERCALKGAVKKKKKVQTGLLVMKNGKGCGAGSVVDEEGRWDRRVTRMLLRRELAAW